MSRFPGSDGATAGVTSWPGRRSTQNQRLLPVILRFPLVAGLCGVSAPLVLPQSVTGARCAAI